MFMRTIVKQAATAAAFLFFLIADVAMAEGVEVLWLGHATTRITSVEGKVIVIDPFLKKNPKTPAQYRDLKALGKVDLILITHGHRDHVLDLKELAALTGAKIVAPYGYVLNIVALGLVDGDKAVGMGKGGTVSPLGRGIKIHMVPAEHSSHIDLSEMGLQSNQAVRGANGGVAVGYVIEFENGFTIYHSGDTAVFGDMALIREFYEPDLALVCIGGHFTMDPEGAAYAVSKLLKPKLVIPIHYGTFPVLNRTPAEFKDALGETQIEVLEVQPGQPVRF
jgi:L-ascorbate metabolism protein UlaG (beta-lactamase superfamily)